MATDESGEKTEQPTERRRTQARERGNVARSVDLTAAGLMLGAAVVFYVLAVPLCRTFAILTVDALQHARPGPFSDVDAVNRLRSIAQIVAPNVLGILLAMMLAALVWNVVQVGILVAPEALMPQFGRLNPLNGLQRIFSTAALIRLVGSLAKLAIVVGIAVWSISSMLPWFVQLIGLEPRATLFYIQGAVVKLAFQLSTALVFLALLDFLYQRWKLEQDLRMSKQELRDEMKEMEGDPVMRQRRSEAHRKVAQARELRQVKTADVIITNPDRNRGCPQIRSGKDACPDRRRQGDGRNRGQHSPHRRRAPHSDHRAQRGRPLALPYGQSRPCHSRRDVSGLCRNHGLRLPDHRQNTARPLVDFPVVSVG